MTQNMTTLNGEAVTNKFSWPRLAVSDGSLEALKWLAVTLMTVDHVNKYLFNETSAVAFAVGRMAMPLFAFVLAYNLARPGALEHGLYQRIALRLIAFGLLATPAFLTLGGLLWTAYPLNIMFTLLTATAVMYLIDSGSKFAALACFVVCGALVEFWWPAVGLCLAVWLYARSPGGRSLALGIACCASLWFINGNLWALASLPVVLAAMRLDLAVPRGRWIFYAYYPIHLTALWLIRIPMTRAGYLFF